MSTLRIATVPYLNVMPFVDALRSVVPCHVRHFPPSQLPGALERLDLDLCMLSVPAVVEREIEPLEGASISSRGAVRSVVLRASVPPTLWTRVALDPNSVTSNRLARLLVEAVFERDPTYVTGESSPVDAEVVIGDRALRTAQGPWVFDLGEVWTDLTGLPFVFAVWVPGRRACFSRSELEEILAAARRRSIRYIARTISRRSPDFGGDVSLLRRYLTRHIAYRFGRVERKGMDRFVKALRNERPLRGSSLPSLAGGGVA